MGKDSVCKYCKGRHYVWGPCVCALYVYASTAPYIVHESDEQNDQTLRTYPRLWMHAQPGPSLHCLGPFAHVICGYPA